MPAADRDPLMPPVLRSFVALEPPAALDPLGTDPPVSLRTYALAAVAMQVAGGTDVLDPPAEVAYLLDQLHAVTTGAGGWPAGLASYMRLPDEADTPLLELAEALELTATELLAVALATAVDADAVAGRALARVQAPVGGSRPTLGLLAAALAETAGGTAAALEALVSGGAVQSGLLVLLNEGAPLPERPVAVPLPLCLALAGRDGPWPGVDVDVGTGAPVVPLPPSILGEAERQAGALRRLPGSALVLRTGSTSEGRATAAAVAGAMDRRAAFIEVDRLAGLGPWLRCRRLLPVFCYELGPGERRVLPAIPGYDGPVLALCGPDGSVETAGGTGTSWSLPVPPQSERETLWRQALGEGGPAVELARDHRHGSGRIAHLGALARYQQVLAGRPRPTLDDVAAAAWAGEGAGLNGLAQPLPDPVPEEALVVGPQLRRELEILLLRCRARDGLVGALGPSATVRYRPGVRALFVGPSGTGKTLAAGWLAGRLRLPLYRVDLASITSKYIGETEKNLAQLLARAEQAEVVLLFDEADALFGKRTEIKEANDRFANAQTNYLLQRLESFDGITLLTSNSRGRFDAAFSRRLDMVVEFPAPGPEERRALWLSHLGTGHGLGPRELNQLAAADLAGGHIRNAVLTAAVLARDRGRPIALEDVVEGVLAEYRKLGRPLPAELRPRG